ncbi:MAG TPA: GNAT family N-acetyltransferase [Ignavibacteria bacterium]|nr:GNAT family N-acetyltransferase [Ignavibacteria bacterium]HMR42131.1 GNAT family N-acetyltransferase [Ignavibacteria bacterium]
MSKLIIHKTAQEFLDQDYSFLMENELANNLTFGVTLGLDNKNIENPDHRIISVTNENNQTVAVSVNISPRMMISGNGNSKDSIKHISEYFSISGYPVTSIIGEKGIPEIFADNFNKIKISGRDLIVHQLKETKDLKLSAGTLHLANEIDLPQLAEFRYGFDIETFGYSKSNKDKLYSETKANIKKRNLFVWKDNYEIVSMAVLMRSTQNISIIGKVYTPKDLRGKGYGTSIVHSLSNELLSRGLPVCALFTDKLNLSSAKIYYKVGYRPAMEFTDIYFDN